MNIVASFDSSLSSAPAGFSAAVNSAVSYLNQLIVNPITVNISFGWGEINGAPLPAGAGGENQSSGYLFSYSAVRNALASHGTTADDAAALATLPATDPTGGQNVFVTLPQAQALGLSGASTATAGVVGLNSAASYSFDPANRAAAGKLDAIGVLEHEITEVLGRLGTAGQGSNLSMLDLFRYSAPGVHQFTPGAGSFSVDGQTLLTAFNNPLNGGDAGDWASSVSGDCFGSCAPGVALQMTPTDLRLLDVMGYTLASPTSPPPSASPPPVSPPPVSPPAVSPAPAAPTPPPAPAAPNGQLLQARDGGATLVGGGGADTLVGAHGPDVMTGGAGADHFVFNLVPWAGAHVTDFTVGQDVLDLSSLLSGAGYAGSDPVADQYVKLISDGQGDTWVYFDAHPASDPWGAFIGTLDHVAAQGLSWKSLAGPAQAAPAGSPPAPPAPISPPVSSPPVSTPPVSPPPVSPPPVSPPPAATPGVTLTASEGPVTLVGGAGADTLIAAHGPDTLTGGAGADHFVFPVLPWQPATITDFTPGGDKLDFAALLGGVGYAGTDPVADHYVKFIDDGHGDTWVYFDGHPATDPWGAFVGTLSHVTPAQLGGGDLLFH